MPKVWRTLPSGELEIAGVGVPVVSGAYEELLQRVILKWGTLAETQAARTGVPPQWIVAFIAAESAGDAKAVSPAGATGLMQLMPPWWRGHTKDEIMQPEINATIGCDLLATIRKTQTPGPNGPELPKVASSYNCGSDNAKNEPRIRPLNEWGMCEDKGYITRVVAYSNWSYQHVERWRPKGKGPPVSSPVGLMMVIAGLYLLARWSRAF